ncbi:MAG: hypothetical protein IPN94_07350 [Sphingobacteriales bacterium]|jgi:hypothetical protein|nr:hypothetical protein [Sphingobacteriales bacterium]
MNNFFLLNEAIDITNFNDFKSGISELIAIEKQHNDTFLKHESLYHLAIIGNLYANFGYEEQVISTFIEQLSPTTNYISNEAFFDSEYPNETNAFLGIDFSTQNISPNKQITNDAAYKKWCLEISTNFDKLLNMVGLHKYTPNFKKDFDSLSKDAQRSIIEGFEKAKNRHLLTPFYPDTKVIKDVSLDKSICKVWELRIYTPIALRVYFNETQKIVYLASIEQKSNPNQNEDITKAQNLLKNLLNLS